MRSPDLFAIVTLAIKRGGAWSDHRWRHLYSSKWENNQPISPLPTHTHTNTHTRAHTYIYRLVWDLLDVTCFIKLRSFLNASVVWGVNEKVNQRTKFQCQICSIYFLTEYRLKSHKLSTGHKGKKGRPSK